MTTTVNVHAHGHRVRVTTIDKANGEAEGAQDTRTSEVIEPGSAARSFHAHSSRSILVEEVSAEEGEAETEQVSSEADEA